MAIPVEKKRYTITEYLDFEEKAEERHEFHNGEILAMSGGTGQHSLLLVNIISTFKFRLKGKPCRAYESNMRVRIADQARYVYPDLTVVCGPPVFDPDDRKQTTITNPKLIVEVLSDSTESYDRGAKFRYYRSIPTLEEYVLISQHEPIVDTFFRQQAGDWLSHSYEGRDAQVALKSLDLTLPASEIYDDITFDESNSPL